MNNIKKYITLHREMIIKQTCGIQLYDIYYLFYNPAIKCLIKGIIEFYFYNSDRKKKIKNYNILLVYNWKFVIIK
jgi:hypothetical protein